MNLFRLHAFTVEPQRTSGSAVAPQGGEIPTTPELRAVINSNIQTAQFERRTVVDFQVDPESRTNELRDLMLNYAFSDSAEASVAAFSLATRLSAAMDMRSMPCLFVVAALREANQRQVTVWTFPRDQAFQFRSGEMGPSIQVLTDVFSQTSKLRKAALFEGRNLRNEFLSGKVLDFQSSYTSHNVANFWISRFLQCVLVM